MMFGNNGIANGGNVVGTQGGAPGQIYIRGVGAVDVQSWDEGLIYDTVTVDTNDGAGSELVFFRDIATKNYRQTNMSLQSQLPRGWELIVLKAGVYVSPEQAKVLTAGSALRATAAEIRNVISYGYCELELDGRLVVKHGPVSSWPSGYGMWSMVGDSWNMGVILNGAPDPSGVPLLSIPIYITDQQTIRGSLRFFTTPGLGANSEIDVTMLLYGFLKKPAQ